MTAEIAILNRSSVTLAADSAMTLTIGGRRKVYTTDKIFELSEKDPIGLMIYNNLEFMGAPLDVLIKQFRASSHCTSFSGVTEAATCFFSYLASAWPHSAELQQQHAKQLLYSVYARVYQKFQQTIGEAFRSQKRVGTGRFFYVLKNCVEERIKEFETLPVADCFTDVSEGEIEGFYYDVLNDVINRAFRLPLDKSEFAIFRRLGVLALHRDSFSSLLTGMIFAGYGRDEVFPSLRAYHVDGIMAGRLKVKLSDEFTTSREKVSAKIIPFAQREVVDRFLVGIDPSLETGIRNYFEKAESRTAAELFTGVSSLDTKTKRQILANLKGSLGVAVSEFDTGFLQPTKKSYSQQTEDMVLFMAKQESAHLAEALVNITSLKRKYSPDEESVAGPIDVAVISRSDGFVWVKRKHYFPSELNQRYFARKFGVTHPRKGGEDAP